MSLSTAPRRPAEGDRPDPAPRGRVRRTVSWVITALAAALVFAALVAPQLLSQLTPGALVRIPVEGLLGVALLLVLPARPRRVLAAVGGALLGVLTLVRLLDMGFVETLGRPFDPVLDWVLLDDGVSFLDDTLGRAGAIGAVVGVAVLVLGVVVLMTLAALRLSRLVTRRRTVPARVVAVLAVVWLLCALTGAQLVPPVPVASRSVASLAYQQARAIPASLRDEEAFAREASVDAFRDVPDAQRLAALRGKDVLVTFIESYGRSAIEDPRYAPQVGGVLDAGTRELAAAGFAARSAFLTSPVSGGGSWLAHATFSSGLWIDNQQRDRNLVSSDRLTLPGAFDRAGWDTVAVMPGTEGVWPEARFYGFDTLYDSDNLGYRGQKFSWSPMPDQYALAAFQRAAYGRPDRGPMMAEVVLTSSHAPWTPVPTMRPWDDVDDGPSYDAAIAAGEPSSEVFGDPEKVRDGYRDSIGYSLSSVISWVRTYGRDDLVLVLLGDHQPASTITGDGASRDVPVTVLAKDPAVLDRIAEWGWDDGLRPGAAAPVWRMDTFRDRFLGAFGG
ncbi:MAG: sulfatase [Pseudonocardia sp.]|nr:sulfatase [Pseudonocardia sp.]